MIWHKNCLLARQKKKSNKTNQVIFTSHQPIILCVHNAILADTWTFKGSLPFGERWRASATSYNSKGYIIFGKDLANNYRKELYEFDPLANLWLQIGSFPATGRVYSNMQSIGGDLLVVAGLDSSSNSYKDMWRFNLSSATWQQLASIPSIERRGGMSFNNGSTLYYTAGIDQVNNRLKETWKVSNTSTVSENYVSEKFKTYPNPANDFIDIETDLRNGYFSVFDFTGKLILREKLVHNKTRIDLSSYSNGLYFIQLKNDEIVLSKKFIKQ